MSFDKDPGAPQFFFNQEITHQFDHTFPVGTRIRLKYVGGLVFEQGAQVMHLSFPSLLQPHYKTELLDYTNNWEVGEMGFGITSGIMAHGTTTAKPFHAMYSEAVDIDLGEMNPNSLLFTVVVNGRRAVNSLANLNGVTVIFEIDDTPIF